MSNDPAQHLPARRPDAPIDAESHPSSHTRVTARPSTFAPNEDAAKHALEAGVAAMSEGRFAEAIDFYTRAIVIFRASGHADARALYDALEGLGLAHAALGNPAAAEAAYCSAIEHCERFLADDRSLLAFALERLASLYGDGLFDDARAEPLLLRAVEILRDLPEDHDGYTRVLAAYVGVLLRRGAHKEAEALLEEQILTERLEHGPHTLSAVAPLIQLTLSLVGRGDFDRAEKLFEETLRLLDASVEPNELAAHCELALADTYRQRGEPARAVGHYRSAFFARRLVGGVDDLDAQEIANRIQELSRPPLRR
ncbi:MAG: tetratricopeptide repeat protein [Polyangiales bacterium]